MAAYLDRFKTSQDVGMRRKVIVFSSCLLVFCLVFTRASTAKTEYIDFDPPGSMATMPNSINEAGDIVGYFLDSSDYHGFLRTQDGTFTIVDFPGGRATTAVSVNNAGTIAGYYFEGVFVMHGFVRSANGAFVSFDPAPNSVSRSACDTCMCRADTFTTSG